MLATCGHSVCVECDNASQLLEKPCCAVCKVDIGVSKPNIALGEYAEHLYQTTTVSPDAVPVVCPVCEALGPLHRELVTHRCIECAEDSLYCDEHAALHGSRAGHCVVSLKDVDELLGTPVVLKQNNRCWLHPESVARYFCMTDNTVLCSDCIVITHPRDTHDVREIASSVEVLKQLADRLHTACRKSSEDTAACVTRVHNASLSMAARMTLSRVAFSDAVDRVKESLDAHRDRVLAEVDALYRLRSKELDAQAEALTVSSEQLASMAKMCKAALATDVPLTLARAVESATGAMSLVAKPYTGPCVPPIAIVSSKLESLLQGLDSLSTVKRTGVDGSKSFVTGSGLDYCVVCEPGATPEQNTIEVHCFDQDGDAFVDVCTDDIDVTIRCVGVATSTSGKAALGAQAAGDLIFGTVLRRRLQDRSGIVEFMYQVEGEHIRDDVVLDVVVASTGQPVHGSPFYVRCGSNLCRGLGKLLRTIPVQSPARRYGMAVSYNEQWMAVSDYGAHTVTVYAVATGAVVRTFGGLGKERGQFDGPFRLCFAPNGNMLVCDVNNKRVQELTVEGKPLRVSPVKDEYPRTVCTDGNVIVVGKCTSAGRNAILVFDFTSGVLRHEFGPIGTGVCQIGGECDGVRIAPDGRHLVVVENTTARASLYTLAGVFKKHYGAGILSRSNAHDVEFLSATEVVICDYEACCVRMFDVATGLLLRTWGSRGVQPGELLNPTALSVRGRRLYVMDHNTPRVQVFE